MEADVPSVSATIALRPCLHRLRNRVRKTLAWKWHGVAATRSGVKGQSVLIHVRPGSLLMCVDVKHHAGVILTSRDDQRCLAGKRDVLTHYLWSRLIGVRVENVCRDVC